MNKTVSKTTNAYVYRYTFLWESPAVGKSQPEEVVLQLVSQLLQKELPRIPGKKLMTNLKKIYLCTNLCLKDPGIFGTWIIGFLRGVVIPLIFPNVP